MIAAVQGLLHSVPDEPGVPPAALRQLLLVCAALQLSGGGLSEGALLAALTKEFSLAAAPLLRARSPSRAGLCAAYLSVARAIAVVALLDGRPYDALVALHTADRALGASAAFNPSGSLQARATPSDGLLAGLCSGDPPSRGARRGGSTGTSPPPPSYTALEHALVASAILLHVTPGRGAEVGGRPSAVGRAGGLNLRRGALDVQSLIKRSGVDGGGIVVAGERLARLAAATPLSTPSGELSPRVWELVGHASAAVGDLSAARVGYALGGLDALPALAATCLLCHRVEEALALGARCSRVLDGLSAAAAHPAPAQAAPHPLPTPTDLQEEEEAAHAAAFPYRLTCWVLGCAMGSYFCAHPFSYVAGEAAASASLAAALAACADGQPMCGGGGSGRGGAGGDGGGVTAALSPSPSGACIRHCSLRHAPGLWR